MLVKVLRDTAGWKKGQIVDVADQVAERMFFKRDARPVKQAYVNKQVRITKILNKGA